MTQAKVTSKGQITIPKMVRDALGIHEGDSVLFRVEGERAVLLPVHRKSQHELHGALPATRPFPGRGEIRRHVKEERARRFGGEDEG